MQKKRGSSLQAKNPSNRLPVALGHGGGSTDDGGGAHLAPEPGQVGAGKLRPGVHQQQRRTRASSQGSSRECIGEVFARCQHDAVHRKAQSRLKFKVGDHGARLEAGGAAEAHDVPDAGGAELALHRGGDRGGAADDDRPGVPARAN